MLFLLEEVSLVFWVYHIPVSILIASSLSTIALELLSIYQGVYIGRLELLELFVAWFADSGFLLG